MRTLIILAGCLSLGCHLIGCQAPSHRPVSAAQPVEDVTSEYQAARQDAYETAKHEATLATLQMVTRELAALRQIDDVRLDVSRQMYQPTTTNEDRKTLTRLDESLLKAKRAINTSFENLANVQTIGYRRRVLVAHPQTEQLETRVDPTNGVPVRRGGSLDLMIDGPGLFQVRIADSVSATGVAYTRAGHFMVNADGDVVLGTSDGPLLLPPINVPPQTQRVVVSSDGIVSVDIRGELALMEVGQLEIAQFVNPGGLRPIGNNLFVESSSSGTPITGSPAEGMMGRILFGFLEQSNVDPIAELREIYARIAWLRTVRAALAAVSTLEQESSSRQLSLQGRP